MISSMSILNRACVSQALPGTSLQSQLDGLVGRFVEEATNPQTLAALMAGGMAYRVGRLGMMGLPVGAYGRTPAQIVSIAVGLGSEVTAFEFTNRALQSLWAHGRAPLQQPNHNIWSWSGQGGWREGLISSAITFGLLKGAGHLAREENIVFQHAFQAGAMVTGHQTTGFLGITPRPEGTLAEQFLHAEAVNLQLGAGMSLVHGMAPGLMALERGLDLSLRTQNSSTSLFQRLSLQNSLLIENRKLVFAEGIPENPHILLMASNAGGKGEGGNVKGSSLPTEGAGRSVDNPTSSLKTPEGEERYNFLDGEMTDIFRRSLPEEIREIVDRYIFVMKDHLPELRHNPVVLMARALAESLEDYNRQLEPRSLNFDPSSWQKTRKMRDWIRDSFGENLKIPGFLSLGVHYDRALTFVSLPSVEEEASQKLTDSLGEQVFAALKGMEDFDPDDPRLPHQMRILGTRIGSYARDSYLSLLDFALKNSLVTRRFDSVDNKLLNDFRRRFQRLYPQGFPDIEGDHVQVYYNFENMIQNLREKWGSFHPFLRGYDREFGVLGQNSQDVLQRYQIIKRVESQFWIDDNSEDPSDEDIN